MCTPGSHLIWTAPVRSKAPVQPASLQPSNSLAITVVKPAPYFTKQLPRRSRLATAHGGQQLLLLLLLLLVPSLIMARAVAAAQAAGGCHSCCSCLWGSQRHRPWCGLAFPLPAEP